MRPHRIREKMSGTARCPRLNVYSPSPTTSGDQPSIDLTGVTIGFRVPLGKKGEDKNYGGNVAAAAEVGKLIAQRAW